MKLRKKHKYVHNKTDHKQHFFIHSSNDGSSKIKIPLSLKAIFIALNISEKFFLYDSKYLLNK